MVAFKNSSAHAQDTDRHFGLVPDVSASLPSLALDDLLGAQIPAQVNLVTCRKVAILIVHKWFQVLPKPSNGAL